MKARFAVVFERCLPADARYRTVLEAQILSRLDSRFVSFAAEGRFGAGFREEEDPRVGYVGFARHPVVSARRRGAEFHHSVADPGRITPS